MHVRGCKGMYSAGQFDTSLNKYLYEEIYMYHLKMGFPVRKLDLGRAALPI
jgi:hypothetical protein